MVQLLHGYNKTKIFHCNLALSIRDIAYHVSKMTITELQKLIVGNVYNRFHPRYFSYSHQDRFKANRNYYTIVLFNG